MRKLLPRNTTKAKTAALFCVSALLLICTHSATTASRMPPAPCPNPPDVVINSPQVPTDVFIPDDFNGNPINFFDDYSWRSFIALVWPAQPGQRGVPDTSKTINGDGPRVFETYKSAWEVFHKDGSAPTDWNTYEDGHFNACEQAVKFGDLVVASFSKFSDVGQADFGVLVGPLVAQNMTYTRYLTTFNQKEFDKIKNDQLYRREKLGTQQKPVFFGEGALDVKSAWIEMKDVAHPERYYQRQAWIMDLVSGRCEQKMIGLVGLHIVQKTSSRPQWIWSSFEHIDNIPQSGANAPFAFNDGSGTPMPPNNPIHFPPPETPSLKFNVQRVKPIANETRTTNNAYRQALAQQNSVWQFYQLVMTQWPLQLQRPAPIPPTQSGQPGFTFPGTGATTAFSNVTMETFDQARIARGCMACHDATKDESDFVWVVNTHAFDPSGGGLLRDPAFRTLKQLLEVHREDEKKEMNRMMLLVQPKAKSVTRQRNRHR